jgi:hypothetical protein
MDGERGDRLDVRCEERESTGRKGEMGAMRDERRAARCERQDGRDKRLESERSGKGEVFC